MQCAICKSPRARIDPDSESETLLCGSNDCAEIARAHTVLDRADEFLKPYLDLDALTRPAGYFNPLPGFC